VYGTSGSGTGAVGTSNSGVGVWGSSQSSSGVGGVSQSGHGVHGDSQSAAGVVGTSKSGAGVLGQSESWIGVHGISTSGAGVFGHSETAEAVYAESNSPTRAALAAFNLNPTGTGAAVYAKKAGNVGHAAFFEGNVEVTGDIFLRNADCAEEFTVSDPSTAIPGATMIIREDGKIQPCSLPYDRRVVGVISGAGSFNPGLILDKQGGEDRRPIALLGKVYCLVDAAFGKIVAGDLLTTSETLGHAMLADDVERMMGTVIGKALATLETGRGLIPVLVASRW
jgi:hypothetical protein